MLVPRPSLNLGRPHSVAPEKARTLLDKIPDLVPEDPALAPLLAEEMAKAYGSVFAETTTEKKNAHSMKSSLKADS